VGSSAFLLTAITAAAFRVILGSDAGIGYNTTALSSHRFSFIYDEEGNAERDENGLPLRGEQDERTPWELSIRPDVLVAVFNSRHYGYLLGAGSFIQPFAIPPEEGDNPEGNGNLLLGARLRLGRSVIFHPGAYIRLASSNSFVESHDELGSTQIEGQPFTALYGGGWLEAEIRFGSRARMLLRAEIEAWSLENNPESAFYIPINARAVQPSLTIQTLATAYVDITRRNGLAFEVGFEDALFLRNELHTNEYTRENASLYDQLNEQLNRDDFEQQYTITGRVVYRRAWLPNLYTDISLGVVGLRPRDSDQAEPNPGEWLLAGGWQLNAIGGASLVYFGRPRWLTIRFGYERDYEQLDFRNLGSAQDSIDLIAAFGPFNGFTAAATLSWSRLATEVHRLRDDLQQCPLNPENCRVLQESREETGLSCAAYYDGVGQEQEQCDYEASWTRTFNTIGLAVDLRYMFDAGPFTFGPFFEGYIFGRIGEARENPMSRDDCEDSGSYLIEPYVDNAACYLPAHHHPVEAILMLGFRLQWNGGNARNPRQGQGQGGAVAGSRAERRLALQRMSREEQRVPGFGYRMDPMGSDEASGFGLFGQDDPMGRIDEPMFRLEGDEEGLGEEALPGDGDLEEDWLGESPEEELAPNDEEPGVGDEAADEEPREEGAE
jgi:hypothetical protein